ncbi:uncharacterized protein PAC_04806 [Phialocephala subalpina]|uniref:F-box domain-containing protein n=1 Tax=Phialocephala subalpina TaxID=576137 RepID=A0A1L7WQ89_9HELO|nr:uncharacterized protein PAC_04806 [Phialocephala subalpina]
MANLNSLPTEILQDILYRLNATLPELRNYSLVCKKLSGLANAELYKNIDLNHENDWQANAKTERRLTSFLHSLAENPKLGALVRTLKTAEVPVHKSRGDVDLKLEDSVYIAAARNLTQIKEVALTPCLMSAHILANLQRYSQLEELEVKGLKPEERIWTSTSTISLTSLKCIIPSDWQDQRPPFETASFLLNVAETTCPNLQSIDVTLKQIRGTPPPLPTVDPSIPRSYLPSASNQPALKDLRHLGFHFQDSRSESSVQDSVLQVVEKYKHSLVSLSIPLETGYNRGTLNFLLKIADLLPSLKILSLSEPQDVNFYNTENGDILTGFEFFDNLTTGFVERRIELERFEAWDLHSSFGERMGRLFGRWKGLKCLRVGDADNENTAFGNDGRLDFYNYRSHILNFAKALPPSLEELTLEINGPDLFCDDDEDFDPISNLGPEIFTTLLHLRSFDIHAWITDCDGGIGAIPEKAIFFRRLPSAFADPSSEFFHQPQDPKIRELCTSRMDCIYQESSVVATKQFHSLKLVSGETG